MAGVPVLGLAGILMATQLVPPTADTGVLRQRLRIAEDARASRPEQRDLLVGAVSHEDVGVRLLAVRALGR